MKQAITITALILWFVLAGCDAVRESDRERTADTDWKVVATLVGDRRIAAIKAIREVTSLGLRDAKDLADTVPSVIVSGVSRDEAEAAANKLREAGMTVQVQRE